jgi:hypothetical protein
MVDPGMEPRFRVVHRNSVDGVAERRQASVAPDHPAIES